MTVQPETLTSKPASTGAASPKPKSALRRLLIVTLLTLIVAMIVAWGTGVFRPRPRIVIITSTPDAYWDRVVDGANAAAHQFNARVQVIRCKGDEPGQSRTIREVLANNPSGIGVSPVDPQAQAALLKEVAQKTTLITFDSDCPASQRLAFIGTDNYVAGRLAAQLLRDALPDGGEVILSVGTVDKANGRQRRQGLIDNLSDRPVDAGRAPDPLDAPIKAGNYTIVGTLIDNADPAKATTLAVDAIKSHPNLKCIVGLFGYTGPALLDAMKQTDKMGKIKIVAFDEATATLDAIEAGQIAGTIVQDQYNMGYDTVRVLCEIYLKVPQVEGLLSRSEYLPARPVFGPEEVRLIRYEKEREKSRPEPTTQAATQSAT